MSQRWTASTRRGRLLALACLLGMLCSTEGCITGVHSFVAVEPLDLHEGYRQSPDSLLSSGRLSLATRQAEAARAQQTIRVFAVAFVQIQGYHRDKAVYAG